MVNNPALELLISEESIAKRVAEMGKMIENDYKGKNLLTISVLKGSVIFTSDLVRAINLPLEMAFIAVSSYGSRSSSSGVVDLRYDVDRPVAGKNVIIIEDIVDTGTTLTFLKEHIIKKGAESLKICTLFDKPSRRAVELNPDYTGFIIEDKFVVGYGLDYDNRYRNLRNLCILHENRLEDR